MTNMISLMSQSGGALCAPSELSESSAFQPVQILTTTGACLDAYIFDSFLEELMSLDSVPVSHLIEPDM